MLRDYHAEEVNATKWDVASLVKKLQTCEDLEVSTIEGRIDRMTFCMQYRDIVSIENTSRAGIFLIDGKYNYAPNTKTCRVKGKAKHYRCGSHESFINAFVGKSLLKEKKESETKECTKCKEVKEVSNFSKNVSAKDGLQYHCKECQNKYRVKGENLDKTHKTCIKCGFQKVKESFAKDKKSKDGYRNYCKHCQREDQRYNYKINKEISYKEKFEALDELHKVLQDEYRILNESSQRKRKVSILWGLIKF